MTCPYPKIREILKRDNCLDNEDLKRLEGFAPVIGRVHQILNKVEQLHNMKHTSQQLLHVANTINLQIQASSSNFTTMGQDLKTFKSTVDR